MDNAYEDKSEKEEVVEVGDGEKVKIGESKHIHCMAFNITISIYTRLWTRKWFYQCAHLIFWFCHPNIISKVLDDIVHTTVL